MILIEATQEYQKMHGGWEGLERIPLDIDTPKPFTITCHFFNFNNREQWITYNVSSRMEEDKVRIKYDRKRNQHLQEDGLNLDEYIAWGEHVLLDINPNNKYGSSVWIPHGGNEIDGPGWRVESIVGQPHKITMTKVQKRKAKFRKWLLSKDGCCAVTGEDCHDVLEAAHIVAVQHGGQEVLPNGILLRADLHRLYDANPAKFVICSETGQITTTDDFDYRGFALNESTIDNAILQRVRKALIRRSNIQ